ARAGSFPTPATPISRFPSALRCDAGPSFPLLSAPFHCSPPPPRPPDHPQKPRLPTELRGDRFPTGLTLRPVANRPPQSPSPALSAPPPVPPSPADTS